MEAKCDWLLTSDARGTAAFRILPDIVYGHTNIGGGFFQGRTYQGAEVRAWVDAPTHWKNTRTLAFRAPAAQFDSFRPVMDVMRFSVQFNPRWILKEAQGQKEQARIVMKVYDAIRRIDQEIVSRTNINREEIMNDSYLVLTEQEEYVNPHTGKVEMDTDAYRYRRKTTGGDAYYTNNEDGNPNTFLHQTGYERTRIRKRRNE